MALTSSGHVRSSHIVLGPLDRVACLAPRRICRAGSQEGICIPQAALIGWPLDTESR